jgi:ribosomal protein S18 acetylase RimI-like enzyme
MSTQSPIPLTPVRTAIGDAEFQAILDWQFPPTPFYEAQVQRLLTQDVPHRMAFSGCSLWTYRDPHGNIVGFGTLDLCHEYQQFTAGKPHYHLPVLAVNPAFQRRGHGRSIIEHLIAEAAAIAQASTDLADLMFLDVYTANQAAISLYVKCGFVVLNPNNPIADPAENNETYVAMARRI